MVAKRTVMVIDFGRELSLNEQQAFLPSSGNATVLTYNLEEVEMLDVTTFKHDAEAISSEPIYMSNEDYMKDNGFLNGDPQNRNSKFPYNSDEDHFTDHLTDHPYFGRSY